MKRMSSLTIGRSVTHGRNLMRSLCSRKSLHFRLHNEHINCCGFGREPTARGLQCHSLCGTESIGAASTRRRVVLPREKPAVKSDLGAESERIYWLLRVTSVRIASQYTQRQVTNARIGLRPREPTLLLSRLHVCSPRRDSNRTNPPQKLVFRNR